MGTDHIRLFVVVCWLLGAALAPAHQECALILSATHRLQGRSLCLRYEDVEEAFGRGRAKAGLSRPVGSEISQQYLATLGTALQHTTSILQRRFRLSVWEVEGALGKVDTLKTSVGAYCAGAAAGEGAARCVEGSAGGERYRRHDGTCNNPLHPTWGAAHLPFKRLLLPNYADGISEPRLSVDGGSLPNPRLVSWKVHSGGGGSVGGGRPHHHQQAPVSFMFAAWGQLIDHDLTLTAETKDPDTRKEYDCCSGRRHPNCMPLTLPQDDPFYSGHRQTCMNMARSLAGVRPGCRLGSRVQINSLTSYIDANFMYGSDFRMADSLRLLRGGQMKTFPFFDNLGLKPLLPPKTEKPDDGCIRPHPDIFCFHAGDNRVNEQLALGVLHTLTIREHNRIATQLANLNPHWDDETLYQETRHIMAALVQHITYNEFLPQLLGNKFLTEFDLKLKKSGYSDDYDPEVDATVAAAFGAAAFRFGHSLLPNTLQRRSPTHKLIGERRLSEMLQQPYDLYKPKAIDEYLLGMISQAVQAMDHSVTTEVTNHLFQDPARDFGRDLASINIARGREHGIPGYVQYRKLCGLNDITDWHHLLSFMPNSTVKQYLHLYRNLEDIDLWSAGISEFPVNGSMVGAVFSCIIANTFKDLKVGDKFWYENGGLPSSFTPSQLNEIRKYSLSRLLCNTGDNIQTIQPRAMLLPNYNTNSRVSCKSGEIPNIDLRFWRERLTSDRPYSEKPFIEEETDNLSEELNPEDEKPIGFDQVIANLIKGQNKSVYTLHLTDHHGVNNNLDQEKAVKLE